MEDSMSSVPASTSSDSGKDSKPSRILAFFSYLVMPFGLIWGLIGLAFESLWYVAAGLAVLALMIGFAGIILSMRLTTEGLQLAQYIFWGACLLAGAVAFIAFLKDTGGSLLSRFRG